MIGLWHSSRVFSTEGASEMDSVTVFSLELWKVMAPETILLLGLVAVFVIPNLGHAKFRIPLTKVRVPWFLGGRRFAITGDPSIPGLIGAATLTGAFLITLMTEMMGEGGTTAIMSSGGIKLLQVDGFSRIFELIFFGALMLAAIASMDRVPATMQHSSNTLEEMYDNRRQADLYILMLTTALGMSMVALAQNLFILFVGLELASFSTYILVAFHKESKAGAEAGVKYFIVGSVASGVGLYGLSLLYLAFGTLQLDGLATGWANSGDAILPVIGLGMVLVGFGFKVSAAPFHFAAPDAYAGANSPIAGVLATASKAMGMVGLIRVLVLVASPVGETSATWLCLLGVLSAVTMTWGNIAALGSKNPKRMLAYSSVAHAGYLLAALTAVGAWHWGHVDMPEHYATAILAAIFFHLMVLVAIKLGAFLVLGLLEMEGGASRLSSLAGLGRRDPLIATSMFIFMMALAGVPPLAGFMSKFLVIGGIVKMSIGDLAASGGIESLDSLHWVWWLGLLMFLNSAVSVFYYLRVGVVMFLDAPEEGRRKPLPYGISIRMSIWICAVATILLGVAGDTFIEMCYSAAEGLFGL